jgi:hypothetical protein
VQVHRVVHHPQVDRADEDLVAAVEGVPVGGRERLAVELVRDGEVKVNVAPGAIGFCVTPGTPS